MKQVPDRKKLRQEYIGKKAVAFGKVILSIAFICLVSHFLLSIILAIILPPEGRGFEFPSLTVLGWIIVIAVFSGICILSILAIGYAMNRMSAAREEANSVPYIPPITPDTLPADEILVRGSEEPPVAQCDVLLRAAQTGQETPKEELLRVSQE